MTANKHPVKSLTELRQLETAKEILKLYMLF